MAALVGVYLAWVALSEQGPTITIGFQTADGLEAGKTQIKYKDVVLGTVRGIALSEDLSHVDVKAEMTKQAARQLRQGTRFWVVRPRLSAGGVSGLSTIISGAYIELDPGPGASERRFTGLEDPPVVQSDVPGTEFLLTADRIGSVAAGSPIYFRDVQVGQVAGYESSDLEAGVRIHAFVRAPYDRQVFAGTRFWNASGISLTTGPEGVKLQLESLQAVLAGGIAFDTPATARTGESAKPGAVFPLYKDETSVQEAQYTVRLPYIIYFDGSVGGLAPGSPVEWGGIKIGRVTDVRLQYDTAAARVRIPVVIELQPQRVDVIGGAPDQHDAEPLGPLVRRGLRAQVKTDNLLTGQMAVTLDMFPDAVPAELGTGDRYPVIPSVPGQVDSALRSINGILDRLSTLPLDQLVAQANATLKSFETLAASPEMKESMRSLAGALSSARQLLRQANTDLGPAMQKLPPILDTAQQAVRQLNGTLGSIDQGYGADSTFKRDLTRLMGQVEDSLRSFRDLSDYLEQHPEALVRGKTPGN
ncbi:PqiB family protein [Aliidongia dinghuensis]|uniref:PqiB family protein n=1 Tax=Aliidongia dinghuensis TaxID=1867774 RepID=UPI00166782C5|nr:MlaD family protein [Aliidongia dinghuensis]